ncbi:hypothetical protein [Brevundimonas sp.]|uniref:hypothetical protein n=1 Tax=Brevundimonas sp. TaxID=1871086 RepID=UPI002D4760C2|nr:hypothetical protein [Brevundimonas sp.]HYC75804.1 hypothetical protein [Brevundimonas sp.]
MTSRNACAAALIAGWAGYIALMAVHPTRLGGPALGHVSLNDAVHWTGLLLLPVLMYAYVELGRRLDLRRPLVLLAVCAVIASLFAGMAAATMSGLVMAGVAGAGDEFPPETLHAMRDVVFALNQGFAAVHYVLLMIGIGLFALAWPNRPSDSGLKWGGVLAAAGFLVWLATGTWGADVHSVLAVVVVAGAWSIVAALAQRSLPDEA